VPNLKMKKLILISFIISFFISCISIRNKDLLLPFDSIGDTIKLRKNGYYFTETFVKAHPIYTDKNGWIAMDSTKLYNQIRISSLVLYSNGSVIKTGSFSGDRDRKVFDFGIQCDLEESNTLLRAQENLECYYSKLNENNIYSADSKVSVWGNGIYRIHKNSIIIQSYYNQLGNYNLMEERGIIINDSTFLLKERIDYGSGNTLEIDKTYKFKEWKEMPYFENYILKNKEKFKKN